MFENIRHFSPKHLAANPLIPDPRHAKIHQQYTSQDKKYKITQTHQASRSYMFLYLKGKLHSVYEMPRDIAEKAFEIQKASLEQL